MARAQIDEAITSTTRVRERRAARRLSFALALGLACGARAALAAVPYFSSPISPNGLTDVGSQAITRFADLDADGDLDALVGTDPGIVVYFEHTVAPPSTTTTTSSSTSTTSSSTS